MKKHITGGKGMFKDKVVLVTGGATGIGSATCIKLSSLGAKVEPLMKSGINFGMSM